MNDLSSVEHGTPSSVFRLPDGKAVMVRAIRPQRCGPLAGLHAQSVWTNAPQPISRRGQ